MDDFISEDDLQTYEGWLRYEGIDAAAATPEDLANWRSTFEESRYYSAAAPTVGLMKPRLDPGEHRYGVAIRGSNLWLVLWVRCSPQGEFFVVKPIGDRDRDVHTSYHRDGTRHMKSSGHKFAMQKCQPLTGTFRGIEDLGMEGGFFPKRIGAVCHPAAFSDVVEVPSGILGPRHGAIGTVLAEPGYWMPAYYTWAYDIVIQKVFAAVTPNVVITVLRQKPLHG
jgi:hypothetical protein